MGLSCKTRNPKSCCTCPGPGSCKDPQGLTPLRPPPYKERPHSSIFGSFMEADASLCSPPVKEALAASIQQASGSMGLPSLPLGKAQAGISFPAHLTPTKGSFQTTGHTKENSEANIKKHPLPLPGCQGTLSDNYPCSDFCKVFYSLFSFHFVLFSLHKWKNALGKVAHIWIPQVHKEVSPNSHQPQALPRRDTLIPHAFLFISCSLPGENIGY